MSHVIGRGRYARETYPTARTAAAVPLLRAGWDTMVPDEEAGELEFVSDGSVFFRHPKNNDQENTLFLQTEWPAGVLSEGDTLFVTYSGLWQYDTNAEQLDTQGNIDFSVLVSTDDGLTWIRDVSGATELTLRRNTDDGGATGQFNFSRRWAVTVPAISNPTLSVIVGIALRVSVPPVVGENTPPSVFIEAEEGTGELIVERWTSGAIVDSFGPTTWTPVTISAPPWGPG